MATPYNIPTIIGVADICQYLAQDALGKSGIFRKPPFTPILPQIIYVENDTLRYLYDADPTNASLDNVANYVWSLCVYTLQGYNIYSNGNGGTVVPVTPGTLFPLPYDFIVDGSSFISTGVSSITITRFIGYNIDFFRGGITQNTTDVGDGSTYYTWDRTSGLFTLSAAAQAGELFRISPTG